MRRAITRMVATPSLPWWTRRIRACPIRAKLPWTGLSPKLRQMHVTVGGTGGKVELISPRKFAKGALWGLGKRVATKKIRDMDNLITGD